VRRSECFNGDADLGAIPSPGIAYYARFVEQTLNPDPIVWPVLGNGWEQHKRPQGLPQEET
jgi:hypothetical protein